MQARLLLLAVFVTAVVVAACGGSASETPWPVEPESFKAGAPPQESPGPASITEADGGHLSRP